MRTLVWKWATFAVLLTAPGLLAVAGVTLYAHARDSRLAQQTSVSCPSPTAPFPERKKNTMPSTMHKTVLPQIDTVMPSKTETATFGLG